LCSIFVTAMILGAAVLLAMSSTAAPGVRLLATYALKGTQAPGFSVMTDPQVAALASQYISGTYGSVPSPVMVVNYPGSLFPISTGGFSDPTADQSIATGLTALGSDVAGDPAPVIFGYSQGAVVASQYKKKLNAQYVAGSPSTSTPTYVLIGNPDRPNGGLFQRFAGLYVPFLDLTFDGATPTVSVGAVPGQVTTYDIARQYDGFADFPDNPLNLLAVANAIAGVAYVHTGYQNVDISNAVLQDHYGDTAYYLIPTARLPLLQPLAQLGVPDPVLAALDAPLRVLVEAGYDRTISPGQPTAAAILPTGNPLQVAANFFSAIPVGLDDASQEVGDGRPFGTTPAGAYGVNGPPVTLSDAKPSLSAPISQDQPQMQASETPPSSGRDAAPVSRESKPTVRAPRWSGTDLPGALRNPRAAVRFSAAAPRATSSTRPATPRRAGSPTAPVKP
jgi:hypothetical protein